MGPKILLKVTFEISTGIVSVLSGKCLIDKFIEAHPFFLLLKFMGS